MDEPYSLGSINVDTTKELFAFLGQVYPFSDEVSKDAYAAKVASIDSAGNPNEVETPLPVPALPPTDSTPTEPEAETPTEDTVEGTEEATAPVATANAPAPTPAAEASGGMTPEEKVAALEAELADAKAALSQGSS